jgi:hypothetical protein
MMRFAAYYGLHYWPQLELAAYNVLKLAAIGQDLFRFEPILMVRYRWPQPQASEDALMKAWHGPGQISLVLQKHPIRGVWAAAQIYSALFCSYSIGREQLQLL